MEQVVDHHDAISVEERQPVASTGVVPDDAVERRLVAELEADVVGDPPAELGDPSEEPVGGAVRCPDAGRRVARRRAGRSLGPACPDRAGAPAATFTEIATRADYFARGAISGQTWASGLMMF